nr:PREDICTED: uncharacterized protein LOC102365786 [Latimeria chalumnae]|eukprot:XP_014352117.1 PREDICTED: uncharacterized protein LOC102365786 [Latimeria chalumnae]
MLSIKKLGEVARQRMKMLVKKESQVSQDQVEDLQSLQHKLHISFQKAERQLLKALSARKGEVKAKYGEITEVQGPSDGVSGVYWKVLPAKTDVRPEMVFLFELFLLRGTNNHIDRVVGWGAFPVCDGALDLLEGKFKCPLLRGHQDSRIDQFRKIEELMSSDLDHWLSNLYFQIIKLPRYLDGQKEYEVHLQFPSNILGSPDCFCTSSEKNVTVEEQKRPATEESASGSSCTSLNSDLEFSSTSSQGQPLTSQRDSNTHKGSIPTGLKEVGKEHYFMEGGEKPISKDPGKRKKKEALKCFHKEQEAVEMFKTDATEQKKQDMKGIEVRRDITKWSEKFSNRVAVQGEDGMYYKIANTGLVSQYAKNNAAPKANLVVEESNDFLQAASYMEDLEQHRFSV